MENELKCRTCIPPERHPGCHGECEFYLKWKKEHEKELRKSQRNKWLQGL